MNNNRINKAGKNVKYSLLAFVLKTILTFVTRMVFIRTLGSVVLGTNGLFTNILSMLSLAELGISSAIGYSLYLPLAHNDTKKISVIMSFYRKAYMVIGCIVLAAGSILALFLPMLVSDFSSIGNPYLIYFLFLINVVLSYFITYKEVLATADQQGYIISKIQGASDTLINIAQIILLLLTKNYIFYLVAQIVIYIIGRIIINKAITKRYSKIDFYTKEKIPETEKKQIKTNVSAMVLHKIGDYCVNGTDNIIISAFINISTVGIYSNYTTIIALLTSFMNLIFNSLLSTVGNIIVVESKEKQYESYKKIDLVGFFIVSYMTVILFSVFNDFIGLWAGDDYVLDSITVLLIISNFYMVGMRIVINTVKNAAGMYKIDRFIPLVQSVVNLVVSLALAPVMGLTGVIIGTVVSSVTVPMIIRPYLTFKHVLEHSFTDYIHRHCLYIVLVVAICTIMALFRNYATIESNMIRMIISGLIATVLYGIVIIVVFAKDKTFKELLLITKRKKK